MSNFNRFRMLLFLISFTDQVPFEIRPREVKTQKTCEKLFFILNYKQNSTKLLIR